MLERLAQIKPGDTFSAYVDYSYQGVPEDFPATDLTAQVRDRRGRLLDNLSIVKDGSVAGRYHINATSAQTALWPVDDVYVDVKRSSNGVVSSTATAVIPVVQAITRLS